MEAIEEAEALWTLERGAFKGGSKLFISVLVLVTIFCLYVLYHMIIGGDVQLLAFILFIAFPIVAIPMVIWEVVSNLPSRLEITNDSARYYVNGKLKETISLGPTVKADVRLNSDRIAPRPKAFDKDCADGSLGPPDESFLLLCGISLASGNRSISISHNDGWNLIDFSEVWDRFLGMVIEHDMEMGTELWRYIEFRDSFQEMGEDLEPDIFTRIRAMEH
jgi:hypothetical protein